VGVYNYSALSNSVFFKPEYEEGEDRSNSSESEYSDGSDEEVVGRLVILDWCKCSHCTAATLNQPAICQSTCLDDSAITSHLF